MSVKKANSYVVGISGGSGSGKTSFINEIKESFTSDQVCFLSQDDYYKPRHQQKIDVKGVQNFDLPESLHLDEFYLDIVKLISGIKVERQEYTFNNEKADIGYLTFKPAPIIIVEGLFVFHDPKIFDIMDLRIMIHATDVHKVVRRIHRDQIERNYPLEDVLYRYEHHVLPSFENFISPYLNKVDIVINNNVNYDKGREMLVAFLQSKLKD
jgi:uridine kinase